ncbi:MAG TPA: cation-translocating P-type ATPase C-terminal domain-containing protein, partial [Anaerolineales bacterium]|nr:cation-translocating P-type ATPase C-terminal domain-containing protein [Anaerolineales bacterium]
LALGAWYYFSGREEWQTMVFSFLAFAQVFQALASRSQQDSFFKRGLSGNPLLAGMALLVTGLQLLVIYVPVLSSFFNVVPLRGLDLLIAIGSGAVIFVAMEIEKAVRRRKAA